MTNIIWLIYDYMTNMVTAFGDLRHWVLWDEGKTNYDADYDYDYDDN